MTEEEENKIINKVFETIEFITKNGKLKAYLRNGQLEISSHNKIVVFPSASNVIFVDEESAKTIEN